jgi:hypothetical protein
MPPHGIDVVWVSAAEVGAAVLIFFLLVGLAFAAGAWAMRGSSSEPVKPAPKARSRAPRPRPRHTGTVHVPGVRQVPADDPTVVIRRPDGVSS